MSTTNTGMQEAHSIQGAYLEACQKRAYATEQLAAAQLRLLQARGRTEQSYYKCNRCSMFHLSSWGTKTLSWIHLATSRIGISRKVKTTNETMVEMCTIFTTKDGAERRWNYNMTPEQGRAMIDAFVEAVYDNTEEEDPKTEKEPPKTEKDPSAKETSPAKADHPSILQTLFAFLNSPANEEHPTKDGLEHVPVKESGGSNKEHQPTRQLSVDLDDRIVKVEVTAETYAHLEDQFMRDNMSELQTRKYETLRAMMRAAYIQGWADHEDTIEPYLASGQYARIEWRPASQRHNFKQLAQRPSVLRTPNTPTAPRRLGLPPTVIRRRPQ